MIPIYEDKNTSIKEKVLDFFVDKELYTDEWVDIVVNPSPQEWAKVIGQANRLRIPVRFIWNMPLDKAYAGAVPFHGDLSKAMQKDGSMSGRIMNGTINPSSKEFAFNKGLSAVEVEEFKASYFYRKCLKNMELVSYIKTMPGELN